MTNEIEKITFADVAKILKKIVATSPQPHVGIVSTFTQFTRLQGEMFLRCLREYFTDEEFAQIEASVKKCAKQARRKLKMSKQWATDEKGEK